MSIQLCYDLVTTYERHVNVVSILYVTENSTNKAVLKINNSVG